MSSRLPPGPWPEVSHGVGDEIQARALSLGSCGHLGLILMLTWRNGEVAAPSGCTTLPVIPRCSPPDLVRPWCGH